MQRVEYCGMQMVKETVMVMQRYIFSLLAAVLLSGIPFGNLAVHAARFIPADTGVIQYFGRWDLTSAGEARTGRGAVYLRVGFTGTSLRIRLKDTKNWWRYTIDGREYTKFKPRMEECLLAKDLLPGRHQLFLVRCTEGEFGISQFTGLVVDDGAELFTAGPASSRRIEVIGDSISAGAMNDGPAGLSYRTREDGSVSFAPELARRLQAEWSVVAKSGEGIIHNYTEDVTKYHIHTQDTYERTFYTRTQPVWKPVRFAPQVVLINMGANDFSDPMHRPAEKSFITGYKHLIRLVRVMNPEAVILGVEPVPMQIGPEAGQWVRKAIEAMRTAGDEKLYFIPININGPLLQPEDYVGDGMHPTVAGSKKIAAYLQGCIAEIMGWK